MSSQKVKLSSVTAHASEDEIEAAISALSVTDEDRLHGYADFRARALAARGLGVDAKDLLQEALRRTLAGTRHWPKNVVSFVVHLIATMRSIANAYAKKTKGATAVPGGAGTDDEDVEAGMVDLPTAGPDPERIVQAREELQRIERLFAKDQLVTSIMEGLGCEMKGPEIQTILGISETEYETAMTRLRRGARGKE